MLFLSQTIRHEGRKDFIVITTNRTYPLSFVTQILRNSLPSHGDDRKTFEVMNSEKGHHLYSET